MGRASKVTQMDQPNEVSIPDDAREWRPQIVHVGRYVPEIVNPILEPLWTGTRVIAHYRDAERDEEWGTVEVYDEFGDEALDLAMPAFDQLRRAIRASEAVVDGIVTDQATGGGEGAGSVIFAQAQPFKRMFIGGPASDIQFAAPRSLPRTGDPAFVALDLLRLDGQPLFDVPLLERKRLLDGLVDQSELVRVSPWVRPPLRSWFSTWQSAGLRGVMMKGANSRYTPGVETTEWAKVTRMPRA